MSFKSHCTKGKNCLLLNNNGKIIIGEWHRQNLLSIIFVEQNSVVFSYVQL